MDRVGAEDDTISLRQYPYTSPALAFGGVDIVLCTIKKIRAEKLVRERLLSCVKNRLMPLCLTSFSAGPECRSVAQLWSCQSTESGLEMVINFLRRNLSGRLVLVPSVVLTSVDSTLPSNEVFHAGLLRRPCPVGRTGGFRQGQQHIIS